MLIIYDTLTGNTERFVKKLNMDNMKIYPGLIIDKKFVLVTYTFNEGNVPEKTEKFLEDNHKNLIGVASSGNRNWDLVIPGSFARAANIISDKYNVPIIHKFELHGTTRDIDKFIQGCKNSGIYQTE